MIAIVGAPAQRDLAQIARAQHEAADLVGIVHDDLRALAGLAVLVTDIVYIHAVADIGKVLRDSGADRDGEHGAADALHELFGVALGARARAKARHGDADDALFVPAGQVIGIGGGKKSKRGIQTAGNADDQLLSSDLLHAANQALSLNVQRIEQEFFLILLPQV